MLTARNFLAAEVLFILIYSYVIDLNSMRGFKYYRKTSIVFIICEVGSVTSFASFLQGRTRHGHFMLQRQGAPAGLIKIKLFKLRN